MADERIRYVWGGNRTSRAQEVYAMDGVVRVAINTAYFGKPESHVVKIYPKRLLVRGRISKFDKKTVALRGIDNE